MTHLSQPTLLQTLLGRPSQHYVLSPPKDYHSNRQSMLRIAAELAAADAHATANLNTHVPEPPAHDDDMDVFYTPNTSPRTSVASDTSMTITTPPTSDADHALYTDQDWAKDVKWLVDPPSAAAPIILQKTKRVPPPAPRTTRSPTPSIMMSMTALLEEDEDAPSITSPRSSVLISGPAPLSSPPRTVSLTQRLRSSLRRERWPRRPSRSPYAGAPHLAFTHYRPPPRNLPKNAVLVQVWAVALDAVDQRLLGGGPAADALPRGARVERTRSRTQSLGRLVGRRLSRRAASDVGPSDGDASPPQAAAQVGFVPGRSFVGRVLECGWEVREEVAKRGEWVVGLLDVRRSGALAEFITVDRHRIHRDTPYPRPSSVSFSPESLARPPSSASSHAHHRSASSNSSHRNMKRTRQPPPPPPTLTLAELARLPLCGVAAHRAVRTLTRGAADGEGANGAGPGNRVRRRALVLRGHDGIGGLAARMLVRAGWRVCVHAPSAPFSSSTSTSDEEEHMRRVQARVRAWGVEEVVFDDGGADEGGRGAAVRAVERLIADGDAFDAVLDTVGGRAVWDAGERLLARGGGEKAQTEPRPKQFTTTVGDCPARPVPTAADNFRAGLRALRGSAGDDGKSAGKGNSGDNNRERGASRAHVGYAWVSAAQDVDWEGADVRGALGALLGAGVALFADADGGEDDTLPFERAPEAFGAGVGTRIALGGSVVVRVVG
ncbi:hypothetical protein B0H10DRAFT_1994147 [Mycena sp. CBHHK59/15]|nr:hypothetical protein B0H10DRAFT_1994147 [Mycena sp. CBHHK59/15]